MLPCDAGGLQHPLDIVGQHLLLGGCVLRQCEAAGIPRINVNRIGGNSREVDKVHVAPDPDCGSERHPGLYQERFDSGKGSFCRLCPARCGCGHLIQDVHAWHAGVGHAEAGAAGAPVSLPRLKVHTAATRGCEAHPENQVLPRHPGGLDDALEILGRHLSTGSRVRRQLELAGVPRIDLEGIRGERGHEDQVHILADHDPGRVSRASDHFGPGENRGQSLHWSGSGVFLRGRGVGHHPHLNFESGLRR